MSVIVQEQENAYGDEDQAGKEATAARPGGRHNGYCPWLP